MKENLVFLVIDDEPSIRSLLKISLEDDATRILEAATGDAGLKLLRDHAVNLVLLDLGLPDRNGIEVLRSLRKWSHVPVIVLTVQNQEPDKVLALDSGADDYLVKPFSLEELKARIRGILRRAFTVAPDETYRNGPLSIQFATREIKVGDREVRLTVKEYEVLRILAQHGGRIVSQNQLLREVWGPHSEDNSHYLRIYVSQIRKKLGLEGLILTEPGVGYRIENLEKF